MGRIRYGARSQDELTNREVQATSVGARATSLVAIYEYTPVEEAAGRVVDAIRADQFWILPPSERTDQQIKARAQSMLDRTNPTYIKELGG